MRKSFSAVSISIAFFAMTAPARGQEAPAAFPWEGEVNASNVYVRSGAGTNWYPTAKLNAGNRVVVTGEKLGWYQIAPPPGSFSYVEAAAVERKAGGKQGTIKKDGTYVRAGSGLENRRNSIQTTLHQGASVQILGEADGFLKISPPAGAVLYVSKQYVSPVAARLGTGLIERHVSSTPNPKNSERIPIPDDSNLQPAQPAKAEPPSPDAGAGFPAATPPGESQIGRVPLPEDTSGHENLDPVATQPADSTLAADAAPAEQANQPTSPRPGLTGSSKGSTKPKPGAEQPAQTGKYKAMFELAESELTEINRRPFAGRDYTELLKKYEPIALQTEEFVPAEMAKIRIKQLTGRDELRTGLAQNRTYQDEIDRYRANMDEERKKIMNRPIEKAMETYDLEGVLMLSMAFPGENRRFRLVRRGTDNTIGYVDVPPTVAANPEYLVGRFVGIRTSGMTFSASARVSISVAAEIVDLSPRNAVGSNRPAPTSASPAGTVASPPPGNPRGVARSTADDPEDR